MKDVLRVCSIKASVLYAMIKVLIVQDTFKLFKFTQHFILYHFTNHTKIANIGNRVSFPPNGKSFGIESSPFQRCYTKSGLDNNSTKDVAQTRSSIKNFDMSSPLRMLRRSCPQSPRVPSSQSAIQQGKSFDPVNLIMGKK